MAFEDDVTPHGSYQTALARCEDMTGIFISLKITLMDEHCDSAITTEVLTPVQAQTSILPSGLSISDTLSSIEKAAAYRRYRLRRY